MKNINEIKIGAFAITGLLLLVIGWAFLREFTVQQQGYFTVVFDDVAGLTKGSFVRINGLRVGRVDSLTLDTKENKVLVQTRIQLPKVTIPVDSKFFIRTSGYVGDKYLDVILGMSNIVLKDGQSTIGEPTIDPFQSLEKISLILNQLDPQIVGKNIQDVTSGAVNLVENTNNVIKGLPQGNELKQLISQAQYTVNQLNTAVDKTQHLATDPDSQNNLNKLLSQANLISKDLNQTVSNANNLANNKAAFENVNTLLVRAGKIIEQLDEIRADPIIQNDLKETLNNANLAARKVAFTSDEVSMALGQKFILPKLLFWKLTPGAKKNADKPLTKH